VLGPYDRSGDGLGFGTPGVQLFGKWPNWKKKPSPATLEKLHADIEPFVTSFSGWIKCARAPPLARRLLPKFGGYVAIMTTRARARTQGDDAPLVGRARAAGGARGTGRGLEEGGERAD
jgi:hypothetical protein